MRKKIERHSLPGALAAAAAALWLVSATPLFAAPTAATPPYFDAGGDAGTQAIYDDLSSEPNLFKGVASFDGNGSSAYLEGMVVGSNGDLYVAAENAPGGNDNGNDTIYQITSAGSASTYVSLPNNPYIYGLAFDSSGNLYTNDGNGNIVKIPPGGGSASDYANLHSLAGETASDTLANMSIDSSGNIYVADYTSGAIYKVAAGGASASALINSLSSPISVAVDSSGNLYVAQQHSNTIMKYNSSGTGATSFATISPTNVNGIDDLKYDFSNSTLYTADQDGSVDSISSGGTVGTVVNYDEQTIDLQQVLQGVALPGDVAPAVPESSTWAFASAGAVLLGVALRRRGRAAI